MNYVGLRAQPRIDLATESPLAGPLTVYFEPTNRCNFRCSFCPESTPSFKETQGGWATVQYDAWCRVIDQIAEFGTVRQLHPYLLGEPLLHPDLPKMIRYAKQSIETVILTTNGSLLTPEKARQLCVSGLNYLRVSIYGTTQQTHQAFTRARVDLDQILDNLWKFRQIRNTIGGPYLYVKTNGPVPVQLQALADETADESIHGWNLGLGRVTKAVCPSPFYTLAIRANLTVTVCCVDWDNRLTIGDLTQQTVQDVWHGPELRAIRQAHLTGERQSVCGSCTYHETMPDNLDNLTWGEYEAREQVAV